MLRLAIACLLLAACGEELSTTELPACGHLREGHWDQRLVTPGASGTSPTVQAIQRMPDGSVIAGGWFDAMSGVGARNVARWDGTRWTALDDGLPGQVIALAVDDRGQLWAVGNNFVGPLIDGPGGRGGGSFLARWNGAQWTFVVQNVFEILGVTPVDGGVAVYGTFFSQPDLPASGLAIWRDGVWSTAGLLTGSSQVRAALRNGTGLCAGGDIQTPTGFISGVACWNGATWTQLGLAMSSSQAIKTMARGKDGRWYIGGGFSLFDGANSRYGIARLEDDGEWRALDGGVFPQEAVTGGGNAWQPEVKSISFDGDDLVIAGHFEWVGVPKMRAYHLARWSPTSGWHAMTPPSDLFGQLSAVLADGDHTYVGGPFSRIGLQPGAGIATVDAGNVRAIPEATVAASRFGSINDMIAVPDGLVMAGRFKQNVDIGMPTAPLDSLLHFDGEWKAIEGVPTDFSMSAVSLGGEGYAVRSGDMLYRRLSGERWEVITDRPSTGPLVADGSGTLFFVLPTEPSATIVKTSPDDTSFYAYVPGSVIAMAIHDGELVVVTSNQTLGGQTVYRHHDDEWQLIGAWADFTTSLVSSPALGLVAATQGGTRIWNGSEWRMVSTAAVYDMAACSDGVVAAIDEGDGSRLAFLDDLDGDWTYYGEPRRAQWWQITPTQGGIYTGTAFAGKGGVSADSPLGLSRWTTLDDSSW